MPAETDLAALAARTNAQVDELRADLSDLVAAVDRLSADVRRLADDVDHLDRRLP